MRTKGRYRRIIATSYAPRYTKRGRELNGTWTLTLSCHHEITRVLPPGATFRGAECPVQGCTFDEPWSGWVI